MIWGYAAVGYYTRPSACCPNINAFLTGLRTDAASQSLPIGSAGFCWGGLYSIRLAHEDAVCEVVVPAADAEQEDAKPAMTKKPLIDAAFLAHPQPLKFPNDFDRVVRPVSVAIGTKDWCTSVKQIDVMQQLLAKRKEAGVETQVVVYDGAGHGFAVRYDKGNENLAEQAEKAEDQAVEWFKQSFKAARSA